MDVDAPRAVLETGLDVLDDPGAVVAREEHSVLNDVDDSSRLAENALVALRREQRSDLVAREVGGNLHRKGDDRTRADKPAVPRVRFLSQRARSELLEDAVGRVTGHEPSTSAAVEPRGSRVQKLDVVVELGHRADGRARGAHGVGLVDRDCRGNPLDAIDLRPVHTVEKLPGVGGEGLHVAPLPLGIDRVEGKRRLP